MRLREINKAEIIQLVNIISEVKVAQSCLTLCDPTDCSPLGSSVHGISQVKRLHLNHTAKVKRIGKCCHPVWTHRYKYKCLFTVQILFTVYCHLVVLKATAERSHGELAIGFGQGKASVYNAEHPGLIPGSGRSPGEGNDNPLQYYCLENPMDRGTW